MEIKRLLKKQRKWLIGFGLSFGAILLAIADFKHQEKKRRAQRGE